VGAGSYRLRALRIGYRPWVSEPFTLSAGERVERAYLMPVVPVVLDDIAVEAESPCREAPDQDRRMALLWDGARTSLGLVGAGPGTDLEFLSTVSRRQLDPADRIVQVNTWPNFGRGSWPIRSQSPDSLDRLGFVQPADTLMGPVYYGPDVASFFSDAFLRHHCFRLVPAPARERALLGLGFEPVRGRAVPDIEGVLWLDRNHGSLVRLEYHYTGLWSWVPTRSAGGSLSFDRLPGGQPILTGWLIRAPVAATEPWPIGASRRDETTRPYFGSGRIVLHGFREEEGVVNLVRDLHGRVLWHRPDNARPAPSIPSPGAGH
jgi:hypothetical protein